MGNRLIETAGFLPSHLIPNYSTNGAPVRRTYGQTAHRIYHHFFEMLSNPQIRHKPSGKIIGRIFHRSASDRVDNMSAIERELFHFAEHYARDYEVVRSVPAELYREYAKTGEGDFVIESRAVPVPNFILNALVCGELCRAFSAEAVASCDGFIWVRGDGHKVVRLDVDERLARRGFLMPMRSRSNNLITGIRAYRHLNDRKPFRLRSRSNILWRSSDE